MSEPIKTLSDRIMEELSQAFPSPFSPILEKPKKKDVVTLVRKSDGSYSVPEKLPPGRK